MCDGISKVKWFMGLDPPFRLSESAATAKWHQDLQNPKVRKSEKKMYNPTTRKMESFTRVHVEVDELEHRRDLVETLVRNCVWYIYFC